MVRRFILSALFLGALFFLGNAQSIEDALGSQIDIIVDISGNGDFSSVNAALAAVPDNSSARTVMFIRNGKYIEKVEIPQSKRNLTIIGEHIDRTVISYDDYSGSGEIYNGILNYKGQEIGTSTSHTLYAGPDNLVLMNLTVENTAGRVGQAVAVNVHGDKQTILFCRILGNQDTFYTWGDGRFYIKDTYIEGNVDFIFGRGAAFFEECLIVSNRSGSDITAASTDENWKFGYVFDRCKLDALPSITGVTLGRPWRPYCQVVFMNSEFEDHIDEDGWSTWGGNNNHETAFYAVYDNYGPGYTPETYQDWTHVLTESEASDYTKENVFARDVRPNNFSADWNPENDFNEEYTVVENYTFDLFADTLYYLPVIEDLYYKGQLIEDYNPSFSLYTVTLREEVVEEDELEVVPLDTAATWTFEPPSAIPGNGRITITARSGSTTSYLVKFVYEPLSTPAQASQVILYPNPFTEKLNLSLKKLKKEARFQLFDMTGALVEDRTIGPGNTRDGSYTFHTDHLSHGIYTFRLLSPEFNYSGRLIKK